MTPFGEKLRALRHAHRLTQAALAAKLGVSGAYLSALEHGRRGRPGFGLVQKAIQAFNLIWDEAEELQELARLSHPRVTVVTSDLTPRATEVANRLARDIDTLTGEQLTRLLDVLKKED